MNLLNNNNNNNHSPKLYSVPCTNYAVYRVLSVHGTLHNFGE